MKRFFVVKEFFGIRVYDSQEKIEKFYRKEEAEDIILKLNNNYNIIDNELNNRLGFPLKISMNLTKKCNLRCIQCFSNSGEYKEKELTTKQIYKLFSKMREHGTFYICLGGGEPLTRPDLINILNYGKKKQLAISIVSNGLLLTKELIEELNKCDLDYFWISFEGLKENHEKLRGKGTFDKTIEKLELLKKYYHGKTALRMSINKFNIEEIEEIVKIAEKYDIDLVRFTPLLSFGRAEGKNLTINQDEYIYFLKKVSCIKSNKVEIVYPNKPSNRFWIGMNGFGCHCGKEAIWIDELGNVSPCFFWGDDYFVGNLKDTSYEILCNRCIEKSCFSGNDICKKCKNYLTCRGGCRARSMFEYNNLDEVDPLCPLKKNK